MTIKCALVVGANGAIATALVAELVEKYDRVYALSRHQPNAVVDGVIYQQIDSCDESQVIGWCEAFKSSSERQLAFAICCVGMLHGEYQSRLISPEKRLEDISAEQLSAYFQVNTILPSLWLKHLAPLMKSPEKAYLTFISARVGSISDNCLGGWYGYRASKAALNMLLKTAQIELQRRAKNIVLTSYHPGTVDSSLSKPFQGNVPQGKLFTPEFTAKQLLSYLPNLNAQEGPHYIDWQGKAIPW